MKKVCLFLSLFISLAGFAQRNYILESPDKNIRFTFRLEDGQAFYTIMYRGKKIVDKSLLSVSFEHDNGLKKYSLAYKPVFRDTTETYQLVIGKTKNVQQHYTEITLALKNRLNEKGSINIVVRAFDDGVAFRYVFPEHNKNETLVLTDEHSSFNITGNPTVHALMLPNYTSSHEGYYTKLPLSEIKPGELMDMPALFELPQKVFIGITEAALLDYAGMYLAKENNQVISKLSPLPGQTAIKVKAVLPHASPWRVLLIGDNMGTLIQSDILTTLSPASKIKDLGWIHPGKTTFPWWNGNVVPDTLNAPGNNFVTNQYYIDFCARNKIDYHTVVEYGLHQWYTDDGVGFQPGPHSDVTTPVPGLDMKEICDYARSKGVGVRVWVHWAALYPKLDSAFAIFEKWGLQGMMVDFMDRDDQEMVNIQTEILEKAAAHHLHIQFHGAYKPTGLLRTYPNEFTREGTLNYETNKWNEKGLSPDHDINMPFIRMLAGPTDYHLGGFRAVTGEKFKRQYTKPLMLGTRCHMLAMYIVLENYLQMICDYPAAYEGQPGFEFITQVPATWDEIKVIASQLNEYIVIARRKNDDWFVGAITNTTAREINVPLNILKKDNYSAVIYTDALDAGAWPDHLLKQEKEVSSKDIISLKLSPGGGAVVRLIKK